ncbi:domain protein [Seminavis robusta]|uniref:Domain protein n=1 Tax=Seminavis robusta TaxID=568900 RepID=A0A9N8HDQ2_9STRA|nr:domain protein [Seminavis robusta]|eukprot:Sro437_g142830.1 domain protein (318) ;mRNA; r:30500-31558
MQPPINAPTIQPTYQPTKNPTRQPTGIPSQLPTVSPSSNPTTAIPTSLPTNDPTRTPLAFAPSGQVAQGCTQTFLDVEATYYVKFDEDPDSIPDEDFGQDFYNAFKALGKTGCDPIVTEANFVRRVWSRRQLFGGDTLNKKIERQLQQYMHVEFLVKSRQTTFDPIMTDDEDIQSFLREFTVGMTGSTATAIAFSTSLVTRSPTSSPTKQPIYQPTEPPTSQPSLKPTPNPTVTPGSPSGSPTTLAPTAAPTDQPSDQPTILPTVAPTKKPTSQPTRMPTTPPLRFSNKQANSSSDSISWLPECNPNICQPYWCTNR